MEALAIRAGGKTPTRGNPVHDEAIGPGPSSAQGDLGEKELVLLHVAQGTAGTSPRAEKPPAVLIAEDEEPILSVLAMIVADAGFRPLTAAHGKEALELTLREHPALILTDLMMPYLDGASFIAAVHEAMDDGVEQAPPIVLMTAAGVRQAQIARADALLRKPFNVEDVEAILQQFLG